MVVAGLRNSRASPQRPSSLHRLASETFATLTRLLPSAGGRRKNPIRLRWRAEVVRKAHSHRLTAAAQQKALPLTGHFLDASGGRGLASVATFQVQACAGWKEVERVPEDTFRSFKAPDDTGTRPATTLPARRNVFPGPRPPNDLPARFPGPHSPTTLKPHRKPGRLQSPRRWNSASFRLHRESGR